VTGGETEALEVRQCEHCREPAVIQVTRWEHSLGDEKTGETTRDFRCQACGACFSLRDSSAYLIIFGLLLLPVGAGVLLLIVAWRRSKKAARNPVVSGAYPPAVRFHEGPPVRRCGGCSGSAAVVSTKRTSYNGIPTGAEHDYRCSSCGRSFTLESWWRGALELPVAVLIGLMAWRAQDEGGAWLYVTLGVFAVAMFFVGRSSWRALQMLRHPEVETDLLIARGDRLSEWWAGS